ncbi:hypothetical protein NL676_004565 [Syzygium grande]|nr:hypothetical protein NL676_004565 [Syzygium grande]
MKRTCRWPHGASSLHVNRLDHPGISCPSQLPTALALSQLEKRVSSLQYHWFTVTMRWMKEVYTNGEVWKENKEFLERKPELEKN